MGSTGEDKTMIDPYAEPLADYGKAAVMVPLIIGGAIIVAVIILWHSHALRVQMSEMARVEVLAREELRAAYNEMRALKPHLALTRAERAGKLIDTLQTDLATDYAQLKVALLLLEGETLFMKDCVRHADTAEEKFDKALGLMTYASGDMWQFGMLGRARARVELKKFREAQSDLDSVLDRNPSFGSAYYWRAQTHTALGDREGARKDEARARALDSWPPLRDFMQPGSVWTRDIFNRARFGGEAEEREVPILTPFMIPPVEETLLDDGTGPGEE